MRKIHWGLYWRLYMQSIDIFDTAIFRDVYEPKDIFYLVEKELGNCYAEKRILAEKLAKQEKGCYNYETIRLWTVVMVKLEDMVQTQGHHIVDTSLTTFFHHFRHG